MKRLVLISALFLVILYSTTVFAGDVYTNSSATLYSEPNKLPKAKGSATITCNTTESGHEWLITLDFSGLVKNKDYIFQISAQDQLWIKYDIPVKSNKSGSIKWSNYITDLDSQIQESGPFCDPYTQYFLPGIAYSQFDLDNGYAGYTILRLLDLSGASGGLKLANLDKGFANGKKR